MTTASHPPSATTAAGAPLPPIGMIARILVAIFGVLLPIVTLGVEYVTHICADFFDPIPTPVHGLAIALVAGANLLALLRLTGSGGWGSWPALIRFNGIALGVALFYSLCLSWLAPFAAIAILYFGLGLLPLAPLFSLVVAGFLRLKLGRPAETAALPLPRTWVWLLGAFVGLLLLEIPGGFQAWAERTAVTGEPAQQVRAVARLRQWGSETRLLASCHHAPENVRGTVYRALFGEALSLQDHRQLYYRVTGRSFNSQPAPPRTSFFGGGRSDGDIDEWVWDDDQGGEQVGRHLKGLYQTQSRLDGTVEGDAMLGYVEWTMVFRNDHASQQREARALLQLPTGGVVSRLTLWIDGEEREAAFGGRSQVRQAYQAVVNQRRDPVLVTTRGPDRVLMQCFPIQPKGGEMKVRLGITFPLGATAGESARFALPRVVEQNYSAASGLGHGVWLESSQLLATDLPTLQSEAAGAARSMLRGSVAAADFNRQPAVISIERERKETAGWVKHPLDPQLAIVQQVVPEPASPGAMTIVLDGSGDLAPVAHALAEMLEQHWPGPAGFRLMVAGDTVRTCPEQDTLKMAAWLREQKFVGGQDVTDALREAAEGAGTREATILWIHGGQPLAWHDSGALEQNLSRSRGKLRLWALPAVSGPNVVLEKLGNSPHLTALGRTGAVAADLKRALDRLQGRGFVVARGVRPLAETVTLGREASAHVGRLWAADEVRRLLAGGSRNQADATKLAVRMQLVTAVSGAVVLETKQQYDAAGLEPVDPKTVPTVPETGATLTLLLGGVIVMVWLARQTRQARGVTMPAGARSA